jgi:hypothetical protein
MMTVWPSAFSRCGAISRPITSFDPPAGNGTIRRMVCVGQVWAAAVCAPAATIPAIPSETTTQKFHRARRARDVGFGDIAFLNGS